MNTSSSHTTPNLTDIFAYVDAHRQEFLDRLIDYVRRPGTNGLCRAGLVGPRLGLCAFPHPSPHHCPPGWSSSCQCRRPPPPTTPPPPHRPARTPNHPPPPPADRAKPPQQKPPTTYLYL